MVGMLMLTTGLMALWSEWKKLSMLAVVSVLVMAVVQFQITTPRSLTDLTGDQQRVVELRKSAYPPITWLPIAYWLEEKPVTVAVGRWAESLFESLDLNQYFFAFHPRERVGHQEVEKIPFLLMPICLWGIWKMAHKKVGQATLVTTLLAIMVLAIFGNLSPLGAIVTWPMWVMSIGYVIWPKK